MTHYDKRWLKLFAAVVVLLCACALSEARRSNANLTACQHLRRVESRRSKAFTSRARAALQMRVPRCNKKGEFEPIQCLNEKSGENCWCVDDYGVEIPGTKNSTKSSVDCVEPASCPASACRMFCPSGFARDAQTGCSVCRCRDPCEGIDCPNGQSCQVHEVRCKTEPCPPLPTCKKARSIANYCPAGLPLAIEDSVRPFLCGIDAGKPQCPPLYRCVVDSGNDYGVCCPSSLRFQKPGVCPAPETAVYTERTGYMCGAPCTHDLECRNSEKCCFTKGCQSNCQAPHNVTTCHQARTLSDILAINEREGRGYVPDCSGPGGIFTPRQCSRNGLVCWCVDPRTGHKIQSSMGAANAVNCEGWENMISRSLGRSFNMEQCDTNICAAVCEYGFKNDHNGCPTCECAEPCEGFKCSMGSHCEVATDPLCTSGSALCASWPVCKPDLVYSNPCDIGTPLSDNVTGEVIYCFEERQSRAFKPTAFFETDAELETKQARSMTNRIMCPSQHKCTKLHREEESVCCPLPDKNAAADHMRQQTMCEYLRDFSERMEGTEAGMQLAIGAPRCTDDGNYRERQCALRKIEVTRGEQRKILEENTIRRMRMLLSSVSSATNTATTRSKRDVERLKLYRVDDSTLKVQLAAPVMGRSAKVIDVGADRQQGLGQLFETDFKKVQPAPKRPTNDQELVTMEVEECWCVDSFGTEIPRSRGFNVTDETCVQVHAAVDCLDLTCRMGCEYGFTLDPDTRCPACQCRDPCDGITCGEGKECRIVDVSCDEEYCPPVPACLPRKPGQCPFLVPPPGADNLDANTCAYECRTDSHCDGAKRCCSNGCGTACVQPQMKTACQHLQAIQMHQSSELGIPVMKMNIAQCDGSTGRWNEVQCSPDGHCWCVDELGKELSGTRIAGVSPVCKANSAFECREEEKCSANCSEAGYKVDAHGCHTCECRNFCDDISCPGDEECQLISVECIDVPCPKMPICVPRRESVCPEGSPLKQQGGDLELSCGPHNEHEICPTTHTCQLNPVTNRGVCCTKTRDVCFESMDTGGCLGKATSTHNGTRFRFSPKANKCVAVAIDLDESACQTKNLFHNELACNSVCPVLTQCERLKLKNRLAAQHTSGHTSVWFQPRCDPVTGHWSPVQCLGKQPALEKEARSAAVSTAEVTSPYGVCWCADKKGAPLKGTLTRDIEPTCNSRQARGRKSFDTGSSSSISGNSDDPLMEELIRQMTLLSDVDNFLEEDDFQVEAREQAADSIAVESGFDAAAAAGIPATAAEASVTERVLELANSLLDSQLSIVDETRSMNSEVRSPLQLTTTRCRALATSAPFPVACDETTGAFRPTQCNGDRRRDCWCVDAAGNQLDSTAMFRLGAKQCVYTPIASVAIELHLQNTTARSMRNVYDTVRSELQQLLGSTAALENLRVQENFDGTAVVRFELHNDAKIDLAFAIESAVADGEFKLAGSHFRADITRSHFVHHSAVALVPPVAQASSAPEQTLQLVLFIMATSSAFLVSVFVVYVMLKRGRREKGIGGGYPMIYASDDAGGGDKPVDFSAPIFVLSTAANDSIKPSQDRKIPL